jgi:uncharacterized protein (TIGR02117 family)
LLEWRISLKKARPAVFSVFSNTHSFIPTSEAVTPTSTGTTMPAALLAPNPSGGIFTGNRSAALQRLLLALLLCLSLCHCASQQRLTTAPKPHRLYFVYDNWHTTLIIQAAGVEEYSRYFKRQAAKRTYMGFGWGDAKYFTGQDTSVASATRALLWANRPALQVIDYSGDPISVTPPHTLVTLTLSQKNLEDLVAYFDQTLALNPHGEPVEMINYSEKSGYFYAAKGHYNMLSNCNSWTAKALTAAGYPMRNPLLLTAGSVFNRAKSYAKATQAQEAN